MNNQPSVALERRLASRPQPAADDLINRLTLRLADLLEADCGFSRERQVECPIIQHRLAAQLLDSIEKGEV